MNEKAPLPMKTLAFALALLSAFLARPATANDQNASAPNRRPDYTVSSPWVQPNIWETSSPDGCAANDLSYPVRVRAAGPDVIGIVYRQTLEYRYQGTLAVSAFAPAAVSFHGGSWNAFWLGHDAHAIGGPGWTQAPVPFASMPFNGVSAGGPGWNAITQPGVVTNVNALATYREGPLPNDVLPGLLTFAAHDLARWREVDGVDLQGPFHEVWFTPAADPAWSWAWATPVPRGGYSHSFSYGVGLLERVTLEVWEIRAP